MGVTGPRLDVDRPASVEGGFDATGPGHAPLGRVGCAAAASNTDPYHPPRKADAVDAGRALAKRLKVEFVVKSQDGRIAEKDSYGNDPRTSPAEPRGGGLGGVAKLI